MELTTMPFRMKSSEKKEVGDNALYFKHVDVCRAWKVNRIIEAIWDNAIRGWLG